MQKKLLVSLMFLFVLPGLLFTFACAKKEVKPEPVLTAPSAEESAAKRAAEAEAARQKLAEEKRLQEEALKREKMAARDSFVNVKIYFDFDKSLLLPEAQEILKTKAQWLRDNPDASITLEGHCDERGTSEYNLALGDRRAQSTKNFLIDLGINDLRLTTISYGEERPEDSDHNEAAWSKNRRVNFVLK